MKKTVLAVVAVLGFLTATFTAFAEDRVVRVYNWSDYIDPALLSEFTERTGIKVVYDVYDSNDILETKLLAGKSGYDVVFPTGSFFARQINAGVFQKLDVSLLPNRVNLDPEIMALASRYDPDNAYGIVYMWGTTGIALNERMIGERMPDAPVDSWAMVFDPEIAQRFGDCGIYMLDSADEMISAALNYLGENPDSKDPAVIAKAADVLKPIRPYVRKFHSSETINALANGDICLAVMWSGDAGIAASRAEEANKDFAVEYRIPKEGAQLWFDMMGIPADAPNPKEAHAFINFLMDPEVIARATNYITYPSANKAARAYVDQELLDDPNVYPSDAMMKRLFVVTPYEQRVQRVLTRLWQDVKSGR